MFLLPKWTRRTGWSNCWLRFTKTQQVLLSLRQVDVMGPRAVEGANLTDYCWLCFA